MNKLGTSLLSVGIVATLALSGCASKAAPGEEATSATSGELARSQSDSQRLTLEEFVRDGGQPATLGGDVPGDGTTVYRCPTLVFTPSATINQADYYRAQSSLSPNEVYHSSRDVVNIGQNGLYMGASPGPGGWWLTHEIGCNLEVLARGDGQQSVTALGYKKRFPTPKLCTFNFPPGGEVPNFVCKDAPSPI